MVKKKTTDIMNKVEEVKEEILTPSEYFEKIKDMKNKCDKTDLINVYNTAVEKMNKYIVTGQKSAAKHLYNICSLAMREMDIINAGFDVFVYREDIDTYIEKVADKCVVCIELENYQREIPDDIVNKIALCKNKELFDKYYIFFTDYTGEERSKVQETKRAKDPILFGTCLIEGRVSERLFFIGDWEDEYCHLTLDKMIMEMSRKYSDGASMKRHAAPIMTLKEAEDLLNGKTTDLKVSNIRTNNEDKAIDGEVKDINEALSARKRRGRKKKSDEK